jgi:hypothetical protein
MALILAVNPGNRHSPTLSRLARELRGCELIGAESCPVAIKAIKKRVPDVLLLPAVPASGEAELLAHLKSIPGGVLTLKMPPVESADPTDLARQIRELLTGVPAFTPPPPPTVEAPKRRSAPAPMPAPMPTPAPPPPAPPPAPVGASPQLLAAAAATVTWIHARQAQWSEPLPTELDVPQESHARQEPEDEGYDFYEPIELPDEPQDPDLLADAGAEEGAKRNVAALLPRVAAVTAIVAIIAAAIIFWPRGSSDSSVQSSPEQKPAAASPDPIASQPAAAPPAEPSPALENVPGTVAVVVPFEVSISESDKPVTLDEQKRAVLAPGKHRLRFQNPERGYDAIRTVQVRSNETTTLTLTPETTIGVTSNEPAEVLIDGVRVGETPYQGKVGLGTHTVTVKTAGAERQLTVEATSKPVQLEADFSKP